MTTQTDNQRAIEAMPDIVGAAKLALAALLPHFDDDNDGSAEAIASNAIIAALKKLQQTPKNYISIEWGAEDVKQQRPDLTTEQAMEVLRYIERNHDANQGVNWDVIDMVAQELFPALKKGGF